MEPTLLPIMPVPVEAQSSIVHSESVFKTGDQLPQPSMPVFTRAELIDLGIELTETELTRSVVIPFDAQKKLVEAVKPFGFGAANALNKIIENVIAVLGFVGTAKFAVQESTFAWNCWQEKNPTPPKAEPVATLPPTSPPTGLETFEGGAVRDVNVAGSKAAHFPARYDLVSPIGLRRLAETYGEGAQKYDDHNWRKGMPIGSCLNHALAHINAYMVGDETEDHMAHAAWNLFAVMHFEETRPELFDLMVSDYELQQEN